MTQLGEAVAIGITQEKDLECPFHDKHSCKSARNNIRRGNATTLGTNLDGGKPDGSTVTRHAEAPYKAACKPVHAPDPDEHISEDDREIYTEKGNENRRYPVGFSAHHLIPGKAAMRDAETLHDYIEKGEVLCCNLGYDVDGSENGVWLPGLHPVKGPLWGAASRVADEEEVVVKKRALTERKKYDYAQLDGPTPGEPGAFDPDNQKWRYVQAAMNFRPVGRRQFHDSHPEYSTKVLGHLRDVATVLDRFMGTSITSSCCKKAKEHGKSKDGKSVPPAQLLGLLNNTSEWYRRKLVNRTRHPLYFTSSWCGPLAPARTRLRTTPRKKK